MFRRTAINRVLAAALALLAAFFMFFIKETAFSESGTETISFGTTGGNLQNGGSWNLSGLLYGMAAPDGKIGLYASGEGVMTKLADGYVSQVNVTGGYVYFLSLPSPAKESGYICRVPADGSAAPENLSKDKVIFLLAAGDMLYYTLDSSGNLCSTRTDGTGKTVLSKSKCGKLGGDGNFIYFQNDSKKTLCLLDSASGDITQVKLTYSGYGQMLDGAFFYRDAKKRLCRCAADGTDMQVLYSGPVDALNAAGDIIYFADKSNGSFPCSIAPDGTGLRVLAESPADYIITADDNLYLIDRKANRISLLDAAGNLTPLQ